jgi:hypothetical protein
VTRRYLLDSGPAFDCMFRRRGVHERVREARLRGAKIGIGLPTLGEIIAGIEGSASRDAPWRLCAIFCRSLFTGHCPADR